MDARKHQLVFCGTTVASEILDRHRVAPGLTRLELHERIKQGLTETLTGDEPDAKVRRLVVRILDDELSGDD